MRKERNKEKGGGDPLGVGELEGGEGRDRSAEGVSAEFEIRAGRTRLLES